MIFLTSCSSHSAWRHISSQILHRFFWETAATSYINRADEKSPADFSVGLFVLACRRAERGDQSQFSAPPVLYSVTRVSKKLRSFFRSIISLIHGNGFSSWSNSVSRPICVARRLAMKRR